ncbi:MAG: hypothetical protein CM15mP105_0550 [Methanobacteriota archaeon]|nr:MAG: hypothetical protein CM15mP105_0550 [Euryarchaeota archaeon]
MPEGCISLGGTGQRRYYVEPEPPEMYINEDGIDCFNGLSLRGEGWEESRVDCPSDVRLGGSHGFDDDGDCLAMNDGLGDDDNGNGIRCDVQWLALNGVVTDIRPDVLSMRTQMSRSTSEN